MVRRWVAFVILCLLARGAALAHAFDLPRLPQPAPAVACEDAHGAMHAGHATGAAGDAFAAAADDQPSPPDCRIVCDLGHAPALPVLRLWLATDELPVARPMGWRPLHGLGPWPPELPPPARG